LRPGFRSRSRTALTAWVLGALLLTGCATYPMRHEIQGDSRAQIWLSEESQVKVRNAQSRVFDTKSKRQMLEAIIATFQDLGLQIDVLDEALGIVSGKKFLDAERPDPAELPTYLLYDEESLVVFNRSYRTWGPFLRRSDLVRMTVTVRSRNEEQLIVRASAQYYLRPVEDAEAYQKFYAALQQALSTEGMVRTP
jgi:hypothetical protein